MTRPSILLVGLGVVGRAIAQAHLDANISVTIADQSVEALQNSIRDFKLDPAVWSVSEVRLGEAEIMMVDLVHHQDGVSESGVDSHAPRILIESIAERLQIKRDFFQRVEGVLDEDWIFCSNTSTLRIGDIAAALSTPSRLCGMHFFMPVDVRDAVEVIPTKGIREQNLASVARHVRRLNRSPLVVADAPGFVVNRMLSPYLNEAMTLLTQGATAEQIEQAALQFGMPLSPLELIDLIGSRTMFDAGRVYWQSFPTRIDPSPMLPALIKAGRGGRFGGGGFYDYCDAQRSASLSPEAIKIRDRYTRETTAFAHDQVLLRLCIPMWIEAAFLLQDGVAPSLDQVEIAMAGGLGYSHRGEWFRWFDAIGSETIHSFLNDAQAHSKSLRAPFELSELLSTHTPTDAITRFANLAPASP